MQQGDCTLFINPNIFHAWGSRNTSIMRHPSPAVIPSTVVSRLPSPEPVELVKTAKDFTVVDGLVCTRTPGGYPAVLLSKRGLGAFGGKYWGYGCTLGAYQDPIVALETTVKKECGVPFVAEVMIGVFRTCAPDVAQSTTNLCYAGFVPYDVVEASKKTTTDHHAPRLFTVHELNLIHENERHWFPVDAANAALSHMPQ